MIKIKFNIVYSLIFIFLNLNFCRSQLNKNSIKIHSVVDSVKCNNEKYYFEFPDVFGKNEINFFNNGFAIDYLNYLDTEKKSIRPSDIINMGYSYA